MTYREYLAGLIVRNMESMICLDRFMTPKNMIFVRGTIHIDVEHFDVDDMEAWLDDRDIQYDTWELYFDDTYDLRESIIDNNDDDEILAAWNSYCDVYMNYGKKVHPMEDLDYELRNSSPEEIIGALASDFSLSDDVFVYDDDELISGEMYDFVDVDELASYILDHEESLDLAGVLTEDMRW